MKKLLFFIMLISNAAIGQKNSPVVKDAGNSIINKPDHDPPIVINAYTEVLAYDTCTNSVTVADAASYYAGDTVLLIQMMGAVIDTSNTAAFGTIIDYKNAGNYEMNFIASVSGNKIALRNNLTRSYDIPDGKVQLVRVPYIKVTNYVGEFTCMPWDGSKGGVLVLNCDTVDLKDDIDVSAKGFRRAVQDVSSSITCSENNYAYPSTDIRGAFKGESIASISSSVSKGKGSPANGGGGGLSNNSGGGGGGNAGMGGFGGYECDTCANAPFDNRGLGGKALAYSSAANKIFMGGGGGAGHSANLSAPAPYEGTGGGIAIIIANNIRSSFLEILANGGDGITCNAPNCNDGMYGGGAGGTVVLYVENILDSLFVETKGGAGTNVSSQVIPGGRVGPGGGGGGGMFFLNRSSMPGNVTHNASGGVNGTVYFDNENPWGATSGDDGYSLLDLPNPWDTVLFKPNIDSVRIFENINYCNNIQFNGFGFTNTYPVSSWQWYFGDGGTDIIQNPVHNYNAAGNYNVKLIVTDINGCKDSVIKTINTTGPMFEDAGPDTAFCVSGSKTVQLNGSGTGTYSWSPAAVLNNSTIQNPTATINATTKFYLTISNGTGCSAIDSVTVTLKPIPVVKTLTDTTICKNALLILTTNGALNYNWSPGIYVSDSTIASPQYIDTGAHTLIVTGTALNACMSKDTINISVQNRVTFIAPESKTICRGTAVQLNGNNGNAFQYTWSPVIYLSNPLIEKPIASPPFTTAYTLKISDNICKNDSSFLVNVIVIAAPTVKATKSNDLNCNKPFTQLNASGATTYTWLPAYALNNDSIANPIANPSVTTTYYVYGKDSTICAGTDSVTVVTDFKNHGIILPNSFSPNNDGLNDCFGIKYYRDITDLEFIIFNRYGTAVFKTNNVAKCWDGNYKGKPASQGNYVYFIKTKTLCGDVTEKGSLLLIR